MTARILVILALLLAGCTRSWSGAAPADLPPLSSPESRSSPQTGTGVPGELGAIDALAAQMARQTFSFSAAEMSELAFRIVLEMNAARQMNGVELLQEENRLMEVAALRAQEMIALDYLAHVHPRRGTVEADRLLRAAGVSGEVGELLNEGRGDRQEVAGKVVEGWLSNPENQEALLSPSYQFIGVGVMGDGDRWVVVALLTASRPSGGES